MFIVQDLFSEETTIIRHPTGIKERACVINTVLVRILLTVSMTIRNNNNNNISRRALFTVKMLTIV